MEVKIKVIADGLTQAEADGFASEKNKKSGTVGIAPPYGGAPLTKSGKDPAKTLQDAFSKALPR